METSFGIQFSEYEKCEFKKVQTFGEFYKKVISKISLADVDDNTSEQGFQKLLDSIQKIRNTEIRGIELNTKLINIFPKKSRREEIQKIERALDVKLRAFRPTHFSSVASLILFLIAAFLFWVDWKIGIVAIVLSFGTFLAIEKSSKVFKDNTIGELVERMTLYNYIKSRQDQTTVNKREIENKLKKLFAQNWGFQEKDIGNDTLI